MLVLVGFVLVFLGLAISLLRASSDGHIKAGGVIMIGRIPIVFGTNRQIVRYLLLGGLVLFLLVLLMSFRR